jgi:dTDP-4-amino-4,6-dideoxygalactose transaminase
MFQPEPVTLESIPRINQARNEWMDQLQQMGISTRPATHAVHMLSFYKTKYGHAKEDFPHAWAANDCSISLPLFHGMTEAEQQYVIDKVKQRTK